MLLAMAVDCLSLRKVPFSASFFQGGHHGVGAACPVLINGIQGG